MPLPFPDFLEAINSPLIGRADKIREAAQHEADFEAARLADEAAGYLDLADEPSPSVIGFEAQFAAVFGKVA